MTERARLPNRRASVTFTFECNGLRYTAIASWFDDGRLGEVFVGNHRADTHADFLRQGRGDSRQWRRSATRMTDQAHPSTSRSIASPSTLAKGGRHD
jgi:hypothetical protein